MSHSKENVGENSSRIKAAPRAIALIGPHGGGKTTLLESIAVITGAVPRKGSVTAGSSLGDSSAQARARVMSVETNVLTTTYLGEEFTFLDCPGSIEFLGDALNILPGIDAAVVVCEPDAAKAMMLQPFLKRLADAHVPHLLFVNKFDKARGPLRALLTALQQASDIPLLPRQIPIWEHGVATGFVDLALERAFAYRPHAADQVVDIADYAREKEARFQMLEKLADYDDHLMEELLGDVEPPREEVFGELKRELMSGLAVPVLFGSADGDNGMRRLLKALRHDVPEVAAVAGRASLPEGSDAVVQVLKTLHSGHGGKLSLVRVLRGQLKDGAVLHGPRNREARIGGIFAMAGDRLVKRGMAQAGDTVALARLEAFATGDRLCVDKACAKSAAARPERLSPVYRLAVATQDRKDDVKLSSAIAKLCEEDPSLLFEQNGETHDLILAGQGEIHLKVAVERMQDRYGLSLAKRQSGGHGQFGDVVLEIAPGPRGSGLVFQDRIKGGVVPKQWIPSVERGVRDYMKAGPLGFPVVDITVALVDGSFHTVDSSDAAFQIAGRLAMSEGMPDCAPVLLEPIMRVAVHVPAEATAKVNSLVSGRRGAPLGFDARPGWRGWETVRCEMPLSEVSDLIVDLRSLTQGVGSYEMEFDRLAELNGKLADTIVATRKGDERRGAAA